MSRRPAPASAWRRVASAVVAAVAILASLLFVGSSAVGAVIDDPDIDTAADYRYRVDPEGGQVEVTIDLTVTADKANRTTSAGYFQYYFDGTFLAIPAEVGDLQVTDGSGRPLDYEIDDTVPDVIQLFIEFRSNLFFRQSTDVLISFTLPGGAARGTELTRVNGAYAGFQAWVDPRLEAASLSVITPLGFVDRSTGSEAFAPGERRAGPEGDELWFVAEEIDPEFQWASVSLARDEALVETEFEVEAADFDVLAWPGDVVWTDFVTDNLEDGLPVLMDEIGRPWPLENDLTVIESYDPYLNGYAGWYDVLAEEIEIGDELDTHVMFHELSHVWFNGTLFGERWITEGLADEFGAEVVEALGEDRPEPPRTSPTDQAALPLNRWRVLTEDVDQEEWAYGASWTVTKAIAEEVGLEVLSGAARAAADGQIAYVGDREPETMNRRKDWRLYLDLLENQGEVIDDAIVDLFEEWVVGPDQVDDLEIRAASRTRYAALDEAGDGWAPPLAVRRALAAWSFDDADDLMVEAGEILERRAETTEVLDRVAPLLVEGTTLELPDRLEQAYEEADGDLEDAVELADRTLAVARDLEATADNLAGATGPLQRIGAIGADHREELAVAATRFTGGDLTGAAAGADRVDGEVEELAGRGLLRLAISSTGALALGMAGAVLIRRRRSRRTATAVALLPPGGPPAPGSGPEERAGTEAAVAGMAGAEPVGNGAEAGPDAAAAGTDDTLLDADR